MYIYARCNADAHSGNCCEMHSEEFAFEYDVQTDVLKPLEFQALNLFVTAHTRKF